MRAPIITFYSYKGGTGRSMGLANAAWILASRGLRVLAVDWDLEAPGLHRFFSPFLPDRDLRSSRGLIDLVWEFATAAADPATSQEPGWHERLAVIEPYAMSVEHRFPGAGTIDLVPAGRQDHLYSSLVTSFDWNNFYERLGGGGFLEALKRNLRERYDYVLIDSRTGLSDTAGICTMQLPDILINCFTMSTQAIDGAAAIAASVHRQRRGDQLRMFPVPMRVEDGEHDKLEASRDYARDRFGRFLWHVADPDRYWGEVEVPYRSFYAYEEILATIGDRPRQENTVLAATERLVGHMTDGRVTGLETAISERERRQLLGLFQRRSGTGTDGGERRPAIGGAPRVFIAFAYDSAEHFEMVRDLWFLLRDRGVDARLDLPPGQRRPDWPRWQDEQLRAADRVILVSSPGFRRASEEFGRLRERYDAEPGRFVSVVLPGGSSGDFPDFVAADATDVRSLTGLTPEDLEPVVRLVTPSTTSPSGRLPASSPPGWANRGVDPSLAGAVADLGRSVLRQSRARILGSAGSRPLSLRWALTDRPVGSSSGPGLATTAGRTEELDEVFLSLRHGRLVLLGAPGSGKSATLQALVEALVERLPAAGELPYPVPVPLPAASWNPGTQTLEDWVTDRLRVDYPALAGGRRNTTPDVAARLVAAGLVLPVLDGLDEMPPRSRTAAISALGRRTTPTIPFVVACRTEEYEETVVSSGRTIPDAAVVELRSLSAGEATRFLLDSAISTDGRWRRFASLVRQDPDGPVAVALRSPLAVWLAREVYRRPATDPLELFSLPDAATVERHLIEVLVPAVYDEEAPGGPAYPPARARHWLAFLAAHMTQEVTRDLAWWELHRALPLWTVRLSLWWLGLLVLVVVTVPSVLFDSPSDLLTSLDALLAGAAATVTTVGALTARESPRRSRLPRLDALLTILRRRDARSASPWADVREDRALTLASALVFVLGIGLALVVGVSVSDVAYWPPEIFTGAALAAGTVLNLVLYASAWARFSIVRFLLAARRLLPWRLMPFLDDAYDRGVLRRTGPVYEFRYALLQDVLWDERAG